MFDVLLCSYCSPILCACVRGLLSLSRFITEVLCLRNNEASEMGACVVSERAGSAPCLVTGRVKPVHYSTFLYLVLPGLC